MRSDFSTLFDDMMSDWSGKFGLTNLLDAFNELGNSDDKCIVLNCGDDCTESERKTIVDCDLKMMRNILAFWGKVEPNLTVIFKFGDTRDVYKYDSKSKSFYQASNDECEKIKDGELKSTSDDEQKQSVFDDLLSCCNSLGVNFSDIADTVSNLDIESSMSEGNAVYVYDGEYTDEQMNDAIDEKLNQLKSFIHTFGVKNQHFIVLFKFSNDRFRRYKYDVINKNFYIPEDSIHFNEEKGKITCKFSGYFTDEQKKEIMESRLSKLKGVSDLTVHTVLFKFNDEEHLFKYDANSNAFYSPVGEDKDDVDDIDDIDDTILDDTECEEKCYDDCEYDPDCDETCECCEKCDDCDFNLEDDENLAENLKKALRRNDDLFDVDEAVRVFKTQIVSSGAYTTTYADNNTEPESISFSIFHLLQFDFDDIDVIVKLDRDERQNLDEFCERIEEKYGFSMAYYDFETEADDIKFTLRF